MRKYLYLFLAAAALSAQTGCSNDDDLAQTSDEGCQGFLPVEFSTYSSRPVSTRSGWAGSIADAELKDKTKADGFGVFAFHTGTDDFSPTFASSHYPNFMYNEHITWDADASAWTYNILKPWPNGNATADNQGATGQTADGSDYGSKVSFFAYAPYVAETTAWAGETSNIVGMSANDHKGHPTIAYKVDATGKSVDLLWGTCPAGTAYETVGGTTQSGAAYDGSLFPVNVNLVKQKVDQKVKFLFKHALAKVGGADETTAGTPGTSQAGLLVVLDIDKDGNVAGGAKPDYTNVLVRDVQIKCDHQLQANADGTPKIVSGSTVEEPLVTGGTLDLATGRWTLNTAQTGSLSHIIASAGSTNAAIVSGKNASINAALAEPATVAKTEAGFNALPAGVQTRPSNVYGNVTEASPLVFIPGTIPVLTFTIDYVVRVKDGKLKDAFSEVKQKITKTITFSKAVELNKKYNIVMHLGLTNIKFSATVDSWESTNSGSGAPNVDTDGDGTPDTYIEGVWLPINVK